MAPVTSGAVLKVTGHYQWKLGDPLPLLGDHSVAKHDIFEQYVRIYIDRVTRTFSQEKLNLTIVDGFCGGGRYRLGAAEVDGSPLRLLEAVEQAEAAIQVERRKGFAIHADFIFVDENIHHIEFLRDQLIKRGYGPRLEQNIFLRCADFEAECAGIVSRIQGKGRAHRSLFFLDQYGWSDVRFATIRTILESLNNPEILLTFAVDTLIDFLSVKTAETQALMNIDIGRDDVRALMEHRSGDGWRYLIQNALYQHVQQRTGSRFYTPFFINSPASHRAYWLLHLSNHRQARDEMGKLHWRLNNCFQHFGKAGFHALGYDPSIDLRQSFLPFMFDDDARQRSEKSALEELPRMIHAASNAGGGLGVEALYVENCNDTPVTSEILHAQLLKLRDERELLILDEEGSEKPRAMTIKWSDRLVLPSQQSMFSKLRKP